ncbi:MAG: hypothetical protein JWM10_2814, partial [Myxococcaceae bacterium]|nr:hypothetical protein [Myxococcaceae bacterium]
CEGCPARPRCPGVDARYLRRFHGDELSAARAPASEAPAWGAREQALAAMFVGEGPGRVDASALESRPTGAARVALPIVREGA